MGTMWLLQLVLILRVFPHSSLQSLSCLNDFINNITCVWNSTEVKPDTACTLRGKQYHSESSCRLMPLGDTGRKRRGCYLFFQDDEFAESSPISLTLTCDNFTSPIVRVTDYLPKNYVKLQPPDKPTVVNTTVSWDINQHIKDFLPNFRFQLEFKQEGHRWQSAESVEVKNKHTSVEISEEKLEKGAVYDSRVRVLVDSADYSGEWSDWSPVSSWRSTAGVSPAVLRVAALDPDVVGLKFAIPAILFCLGLFIVIKVCRSNWFYGLKAVPDPAKFFEGIGDFKKWPHHFFPESFIISQHSEDISPIEVSVTKETDTLFKDSSSLPEHWEGSSQSSSFSNMGYFCSMHPSSYEPCHVYFSYQPAGGSVKSDSTGVRVVGSGPLQNSSSYEPLEQHGQPRHPDSNPTEDQQTERENEDEDSPMETSTPTNSCSVLHYSLPCGPLLFPHNLSGFPHFPLPFPGLDLDTALCRPFTPGLLRNTPSKSSLLSIEPSSGGYMPAKDACDSC